MPRALDVRSRSNQYLARCSRHYLKPFLISIHTLMMAEIAGVQRLALTRVAACQADSLHELDAGMASFLEEY